jgi:hypothetical protein
MPDLAGFRPKRTVQELDLMFAVSKQPTLLTLFISIP